MKILALDIGGANVKVADGHDFARSWPFALWKSPKKLSSKIAECLAASPWHDKIVVTMTGELCDCYETKAEGVKSIVDATVEAARGMPVLFYQTTGQFVTADEAVATPLLTAASNWQALAAFAGRFCEHEQAILIDVGSSTTDIIPILNGKEAARGRTDTDRLLTGELIYTGVERSPVCAIVSELAWRGLICPVAQEFFASSGDAYLLLGDLDEAENDTNTADGKPFTYDAAHARLARMVCGDREMVSLDDAKAFAVHIREGQLEMLGTALTQVMKAMPANPQIIIISGYGEFLARQLLKRVNFSGIIVSFDERLDPSVSRCAPAHALAALAHSRDTACRTD